MSDTDVTLEYKTACREVYAKRTVGDIALVSAACVDEHDDPTSAITLEDQLESSRKYHAEGSLVSYVVADPVFYAMDFSVPPKPIVPGLEGFLRHFFTEAVQNARRATVKLIRKAQTETNIAGASSMERPSGKIDFNIRLEKGWYVVEVKNYGSQYPQEVLDSLRDFEADFKKNGDTSLIEKTKESAYVANEKNKANAEKKVHSDIHGGLGLLLMKAGMMKHLHGSLCIPENFAGGAVLTLKIPYVVLHPVYDARVSSAPAPYNAVLEKQRTVDDSPPAPLPEGPRDLGTDSARFRSLFYKK